jgi:hypothetical protein
LVSDPLLTLPENSGIKEKVDDLFREKLEL